MGYGGGGGAASFLDLTDTPETYAGQALKLVKVNAGETALSLDLLLSFTDWYAGGVPTDFPWVFEANNPVDWENYFSPIFKNYIGQYIIYSGGYDSQRFYLYNYNTKQWTRLADPPAAIWGAISDSPDGSKLCAQGANGNVLFIYDVEANTWTSSPAAPQMSGVDVGIQTTVWADDDIIWCQVRADITGTWTVMCYKYVVSTTTWTQFANSITPAVHNAQGMGIHPAGTILYWGQCGAVYNDSYKYTISTDTYAPAVSLGASYYYSYVHDRHRLWYGMNDSIRSYIDLSDESLHTNIFPGNPQVTKATGIPAGIYNAEAIISQQRTSEPKVMSYFGTGTWKLAEKTLTDYNLVVFRKPADGYAILAIDKGNGFTVPVYIFSTLCLPAGTWEFFYPKDGDYTKLKISGSKLK